MSTFYLTNLLLVSKWWLHDKMGKSQLCRAFSKLVTECIVCATHLQTTVLREICAVHGVSHFVFAVKGAQRVGTEMPCNFLLNKNRHDCDISFSD